ncbi:MAG: chromosome segregation protein SMC [Clostridia bacterium]|nr:chromosome segregation protein SMC [Clostridia bacterium]
MYLKSIELQGFKSFPDRTKLIFDPGHSSSQMRVEDETNAGVTVIVGPNGSGKSNIADAMRWVLGEISSKTLRGSKMEDVIFGGADSRRPMGYAEVSVTFDNTSDFCKLDCPYDEVTVTRRYFRAGESEYLINRKSVRLKDIYELFLNTGIGRDGYSIIGQGRIADMVSRKSEERRSIFEDASGIAKYRLRKNESERKLSNVESNMVRIRDVFTEVEAQVGPLEREAEKAKRALVLLDRKKAADVSLWLYETERLHNDISSATELKSRAAFDLEQADDALQSLDTQNKRITEMSQNSRQASEALREEISALTDAQHALESEFRVTESNIAHTREMISAAGTTRESLSRQLEAEQAQAAVHGEKLREHGNRETALEDEFNRNAAEIASLQEHITKLEEQVDLMGADVHERENAIVDLKVRVSVLENARDANSDRNSGILTDMEQYEAVSTDLSAQVAKRQKTIDGYTTNLNRVTEQIGEAEKALTELNETYGGLYERLNEKKLRRDSLAQRIATYKAMEEHYEGYAHAVKYIMKQYAEGHVTGFGGEKCGKIYGPLSKVITVDQPYITAVETALGANLQHVVVEDEATAKAAMYCLKRGEAGRATFFPLTSMRPQTETPEMKQAAGFPGYLAVADTLLSCDDKFRNVVSSLLGRTVIFDTIDHATAMAKALRYRVRAVTLDGQQINVGGSFTGGSVNQKNSALSRAGEIKRMGEEVEELKVSIAKIEEELAEIKNQIKEADDSKISLEDKRDLIRVLLGNETAGRDQVQAKLDANTTLLNRMKEDCEKLIRMSEQNEEDIISLRAETVALTKAVEELKLLRAEKAEEKGEAEDKVDALEAVQTKLMISLSEVRKDKETEETLTRVCEERIQNLLADIKANDDRVADHKSHLKDYDVAQMENRRRYAEGEARMAELTRGRDEAEKNSAGFEERLAAISQKLREQMSTRENLFREFTLAESKLASLQGEMDMLAGKLYEDYELTRAEAVALNYPPVTPETRTQVLATQTECRNKLRAIGHFDPEAVEKYQTVKARYEEMKVQIEDLEKSRAELEKIISGLETQMKEAFTVSFNAINENFGKTFSELFGGGSAELSLTAPENVLESGIEIKAAPPGKIIKSLMQLSGGEQAFIGVALFFAILKVNPTPFCILDEIEAALDEVNVERLAQYIKRYSDETQFIMITHRRGTMAAATRLYGVTMPEHGISKVLALDIADISKNKENDWNGLFS